MINKTGRAGYGQRVTLGDIVDLFDCVPDVKYKNQELELTEDLLNKIKNKKVSNIIIGDNEVLLEVDK